MTSYPLVALTADSGTKLGAAALWIHAPTAWCMKSHRSRPWRRQVSYTLKPLAKNSSPRLERVGPEILRLRTSARSARSASLFVGATAASSKKVQSAGYNLSRLARTYSRGSFPH